MLGIFRSKNTKAKRFSWRFLAAAYFLLLVFSGIYRWTQPEKEVTPDRKIVFLPKIDGNNVKADKIRFAYKEFLPAENTDTLPVILIHGSPGDCEVFNGLAPLLKNRRVIAVDLPGFGDSEKNIPDYSIRAHARYLVKLLDQLTIEKAHIVGFSMGGGVALNLADIAPNRVASISMVSAIGVQEYELLGNYEINHAIHGFQLAALWAVQELTPHFGLFDGTIPYARNFYDSDQRPLRPILQQVNAPFLIVHGADDPLVPVEAAREHFRLVPQSAYLEIEDNHFFIFMRPEKLANPLQDFWATVENRTAKTRATADAERIEKSNRQFVPQVSPAKGVTSFVFFILIALSTLVSEDFACLTAGALAAQGRFSFLFAVSASVFGIYLGDILLFLAGRFFGRKLVNVAPFRWFVSEAAIERSSKWFGKNGVKAILFSRFVPGLRLPTFLVAGFLRTNFWLFSLYFFIAVVLWTPLLVGFSYLLAKGVINTPFVNPSNLWLVILGLVIALYFLVHLLVKLTTYKGRRLLVGKLRRIRHWEFWSPKVFYPPVLVYVAYLAIKYGGLTTFTCANPAILASGFIGESKDEIYKGLAESGKNAPFLLRYIFLPKDLETNLEVARKFIAENNLDFPIALKPNAGERGNAVFILKNEAELEVRLSDMKQDAILQEFADGDEFGVFYYRFPDEERGQIFAITEKQFPEVIGDGETTLENLILRDKRAVCMANNYFERHQENLLNVPEKGEKVKLVDIGTHSRGAIFLDGIRLKTGELETAVDAICQEYKGFYFGRFDVRTASIDDFKRGHNFKIIELNGVTSEATSIYDAKNSLFTAYRVLFAQWKIAFEIGAQNRARGAQPTSLFTLTKILLENLF